MMALTIFLAFSPRGSLRTAALEPVPVTVAQLKCSSTAVYAAVCESPLKDEVVHGSGMHLGESQSRGTDLE